MHKKLKSNLAYLASLISALSGSVIKKDSSDFNFTNIVELFALKRYENMCNQFRDTFYAVIKLWRIYKK